MSFEELISSEKPVLIDFYAEWCGPCKSLAPIIQELKNDLGEIVRVVKIDIDKNEQIAQKLNVMSVPTLMIYRKSELLWKASGLQTKQALVSKIKELVEHE